VEVGEAAEIPDLKCIYDWMVFVCPERATGQMKPPDTVDPVAARDWLNVALSWCNFIAANAIGGSTQAPDMKSTGVGAVANPVVPTRQAKPPYTLEDIAESNQRESEAGAARIANQIRGHVMVDPLCEAKSNLDSEIDGAFSEVGNHPFFFPYGPYAAITPDLSNVLQGTVPEFAAKMRNLGEVLSAKGYKNWLSTWLKQQGDDEAMMLFGFLKPEASEQAIQKLIGLQEIAALHKESEALSRFTRYRNYEGCGGRFLKSARQK